MKLLMTALKTGLKMKQSKPNGKMKEIASDPVAFISRLKIINKSGKLQKLTLNDEQIEIVETLHRGEDTLIVKGRQIGSSTVVCAYFFWKAYTAPGPETYAILSYKMMSSKHLLKIHRTFYDNLPPGLKKPLGVDRHDEMRFEGSGAGIIAASAGGDGGLRSFTCTGLHMSEYAFSPEPEELKATAISALNNGQLVIESTANYYNDALHQEVMKWERGESSWEYMFFPWWKHNAYREAGDWEPSEDERDYQERWSLEDEQMLWRRRMLNKLGRDKFRREYPSDLNDAYAVSGNTWLTENDFNNIQLIPVDPTELVTFERPKAGEQYAIGVDTSGGVGQDWSVIYIVNRRSMQHSAIWRSNTTPPTELAHTIVSLGTSYGGAKVLVESNNYGHVVINEMKHQGYTNLWHDTDGKDWQTTVKSKTTMFEHLKKLLQSGTIRNIDNITMSELRAITITERGLIQLPERLSTHADSAVAMALAYQCCEAVKLKDTAYLPQWVRERKAERIRTSSAVSINTHRRY